MLFIEAVLSSKHNVSRNPIIPSNKIDRKKTSENQLTMEKVDSNTVDLKTRILAHDILQRSNSQPIYLSSIEVEGGETFSNEFFKKLLSPLIDTSDLTLGTLVKNVEQSYNKLKDTEVFSDISVDLQSDFASSIPENVKSYNSSGDKIIPTKVKFNLSSIHLNLGEYFLNLDNDTPLNVKLNYLNNNFNSNAELIKVGVNYNPYKPNQHLITTGKLMASLNNPRFKFFIDFYNTTQNNQVWQQSSERSTKGLIGLQYNNSANNLKYTTGLSLLKRTLHDINDAATEDVKKFSGDYLKSSIVNELDYFNISFLNNTTKNFPINGYKFNISNEASANQPFTDPDASKYFIKSKVTSMFYKSFWSNRITFKLANELGIIFNPFSDEQIPVHVSDRFYLGGSQSFKGFGINSINTNGANQFYKIDSSILMKLPKFMYNPEHIKDFEENPLRLYVNGIAGNVSDNIINEGNINTSLGFGIKYFNQWANFDLGYYVSKRFNDSQFGIKDGMQFSISIGGYKN